MASVGGTPSSTYRPVLYLPRGGASHTFVARRSAAMARQLSSVAASATGYAEVRFVLRRKSVNVPIVIGSLGLPVDAAGPWLTELQEARSTRLSDVGPAWLEGFARYLVPSQSRQWSGCWGRCPVRFVGRVRPDVPRYADVSRRWVSRLAATSFHVKHGTVGAERRTDSSSLTRLPWPRRGSSVPDLDGLGRGRSR